MGHINPKMLRDQPDCPLVTFSTREREVKSQRSTSCWELVWTLESTEDKSLKSELCELLERDSDLQITLLAVKLPSHTQPSLLPDLSFLIFASQVREAIKEEPGLFSHDKHSEIFSEEKTFSSCWRLDTPAALVSLLLSDAAPPRPPAWLSPHLQPRCSL